MISPEQLSRTIFRETYGLDATDDAVAVAAKILAPHLRPEWIPVGERLPELGERVLIIDAPYGEPIYGSARRERFRDRIVWIEEGVGARTAGTRTAVTHWMPLPPLPE